MKILKTAGFFIGEPNTTIRLFDSIEYEGTLWLVPYWLKDQPKGVMRPVRIIRLDAFALQKSAGGAKWDWVLPKGIPKAVYDGQILSLAEGGVVIENPDITVPIPQPLH